MLLLPAPSRRPPDRGVTITGPAASAAAVAKIASRHGCPPFVVVRLELCIRHSGRYDCRIAIALAMPVVFDEFRRLLSRHGADATLTD